MTGLASIRIINFDNGLKGNVQELSVGEYINLANSLVRFTDVITLIAEGVGEDQDEKAMFSKLLTDIIHASPDLVGKINSVCALHTVVDGKRVDVEFSELPFSVALEVLGELKEVNSSFLSILQSLLMTVDPKVETVS